MNINDYILSESTKELISRIVALYGEKTDQELAELTYEKKPFYAIRSEIIGSLNLSNNFYAKLESLKTKIEANPTTIYTIGYEGKSIDQVIRNLIYKNVKVLIDVRKNAFSMRREFSKQNLAKALEEGGISYIHSPDVGIDASKRNELLPEGKRKELFLWYEENILPEKIDFTKRVSSLLNNNTSVAFLCYENNPEDCHRYYLADFCKKTIHMGESIIHL